MASPVKKTSASGKRPLAEELTVTSLRLEVKGRGIEREKVEVDTSASVAPTEDEAELKEIEKEKAELKEIENEKVEDISASVAPPVNEAVLTALPLEEEGNGKEIVIEKEKVEEDTSDLEDEIWHEEEPSKLVKNAKWCLGLGAKMTYGGEIRVLFETPSGFAIFRYDGVKLYRPDAIRNVWADFVKEYTAKNAVKLKCFQSFEDKASAINCDTGVNEKLAEMIKCWVKPRQMLAVGKREYKDILEEKLGICCIFNAEVMELMWGLKNLMKVVVPDEKSELTMKDRLPMCRGMEIILSRHGIKVKPEIVNDDIIEMIGLVYECDFCVNKHAQNLGSCGRHLKEVSDVNSEDWGLLKLATALMMVSRPNGTDYMAADPQQLFGDDYERLLKDVPKYKSKLLSEACFTVYEEVLYARRVRYRALTRLNSLVEVATRDYMKAKRKQAARSQE